MDLNLKDKIAFIAGSSQGLGYAIAQQLLEEGAIVILNGRNEQKLRNSLATLSSKSKDSVYSFAGDVSDKEFANNLKVFLEKNFNKLDILITNAGGPSPQKFEDIDDSTWYDAIDLSFMSHVRLIRSLLKFLKKSEVANVLTITSYSAKQPIPNLILSNSIRAATIGLTKTLAIELGKDAIRFNSILPGWTMTERVTDLMENRAKTNNSSVEEEIEKQALESPLRRLAEPQEFANVAVFLVSQRASYLTGNMISVDGGMVKGIF